VSNQPHQSSLNSRRTRPLSPRSRRLSRFLLLSALALVVGVLSACGSSDSGEDVEREAAAGAEKCDAPAARDVDWSGCDKSGANLSRADLSGANLTVANLYRADLRYANLTGANLTGVLCDNETFWPDGTKGHGSECPSSN
jgi:uncharacterized protein YjbI with pentapeptide repeats